MTRRGGIIRHAGESADERSAGVVHPRGPSLAIVSDEGDTPAAALHLEEFDMPEAELPAPGAGADPATGPAPWRAREALLQARIDAERRAAVERAYQQGLAEGRRAGEDDAGMQVRRSVAALQAAIGQLRDEERRFVGALEENLAAVAVAIARVVIAREVHADPSAVAELVRRAVAEFPVDQPLRIRVHPTDLALLTAARDQSGAPLEIVGVRQVTWLADARVEPGGSIVEGRERIVDGRVDAALERIYRRLARNSS